MYAVNSIAFHQRHGTFATAGSDGTYVFWDKDSKHRLKASNRLGNAITAAAFNKDGNIYAYALGYDWSKGVEFWDKSKPNAIYLRGVQDAEVRPRRA
jgi:mRNA export factor